MSVSSAKAKLDAQGGDPVTGYISKTDVQESYDELVNGTALTGTTTIAALTLAGVSVGPGTGSPEGSVAAPVGSVYTDKAVTTGAALWVKTSGGTGNTGWEVAKGDTGWRGISTWDAAGAVTGLALAAGAAPMSGNAGGIYLRRTGNTVWVRIHNLTTSGTTEPNIFDGGWNTNGFKMQGTYSVRPIAMFDGSSAAIGTTYGSGYLQGYEVSDPQNWQYMETSWQTPDAWPTSLPGSAATP